MPRMQDKVVLISGAGTGYRQGDGGTPGRRRRPGDCQRSRSGHGRSHGAVRRRPGASLDVSSEADWQQVMDDIRGNEGRLDALINNAGILALSAQQDPEETTLEEWQAVQRVNLDGVFLGCKHAIPLLRDSGGGSIVNLSSIAALMGTPHVTAYGASKGGVRQVTKSVAVHCARQGYRIRCNSVHPGIIRTDMGDQVMGLGGGDPQANWESRIGLVPLGEAREAVDVANCILFLASDLSRHMTGQALVVDGGLAGKVSLPNL